MCDDISELTNRLQENFQVDPTSLGEHPRYSKFKNYSKAAEQQAKRREETLERQKDGRFEKLIQLRNLALDEPISDEEDEKDEQFGGSAMDLGRRTRLSKYADKLMLSEWLVDIPSTLSEEWTMICAPIGKRCLVVASRGVTTSYNKSGRVMSQFQSKLPGGNGRGKYTFTILDCIYNDRTYYVLDVLSWNENEYANNPFDLRMYILTSRMEENPELAKTTRLMKNRFIQAPRCRCSAEEITKIMSQPLSFDLDGLLFYHNSVVYEAGQSPLVGWLKPWMLPEILNVPVCEQYQQQGQGYTSSKQFIDDFNEKHNHQSKIEKNGQKDAQV